MKKDILEVVRPLGCLCFVILVAYFLNKLIKIDYVHYLLGAILTLNFAIYFKIDND